MNSPETIVHILVAGKAVCGFMETMPYTWPDNHKWVEVRKARESNCESCRRKVNPIFLGGKGYGDRGSNP